MNEIKNSMTIDKEELRKQELQDEMMKE